MWTLEGNTLVAHKVNIGMSDGTHTQVLSGIKEGQVVITGVAMNTNDQTADDSSDESCRAPSSQALRERTRRTASKNGS